MEYRTLGGTGLTVSVAGLGCNNFGWRIDSDAAGRVVDAAVEVGVTLFDTADVYGNPGHRGESEEFLGRALEANGARDSVVVATKFGMDMAGESSSLASHEARGSRRYIRNAVENSLRRLKTDRIDLLQFHQPDPYTPIDETLRALDDLVKAGKVLYVGAGGRQMTAWQFVDAWWTSSHYGWARYASAQIEWSLLERQHETGSIVAAEHLGMSVLPFFPLAAGLLSGKYSAGAPAGSRLKDEAGYASLLTATNIDRVDRLTALARSEGIDLLGLSLGWLAGHDVVGSVISGATTPEQVRVNAEAVSRRVSPEALQQIDLITLP